MVNDRLHLLPTLRRQQLQHPISGPFFELHYCHRPVSGRAGRLAAAATVPSTPDAAVSTPFPRATRAASTAAIIAITSCNSHNIDFCNSGVPPTPTRCPPFSECITIPSCSKWTAFTATLAA